jgi:hypothetical protein
MARCLRFDLLVRKDDVPRFRELVAAAEQRACDSLAAADAALRERFGVPERLQLPG